jgi:hypothetical protein
MILRKTTVQPNFMGAIATNVDGKGVSKIRSLIGQCGLRSFLEAVFLEVNDIKDNGHGDNDPDEDLQEARRVRNRLDKIIGWEKEHEAEQGRSAPSAA